MSLKQRVSKLLVQDFCGSSENAVGLVQSVPICTHGPILQADLTVSHCLTVLFKETPEGQWCRLCPWLPFAAAACVMGTQ